VETDEVLCPVPSGDFHKSDRVFSTGGRGKNGYITEYRHGLKANIGLDLEYGPGIKEAWLFPFRHSASGIEYHLILSQPDCSSVLHLSADFSQAKEPDPDNEMYDLSSSTLAVSHSDQLVVQVTKRSVTLIAPNKRYVWQRR
jgi:hypothetical protein